MCITTIPSLANRVRAKYGKGQSERKCVWPPCSLTMKQTSLFANHRRLLHSRKVTAVAAAIEQSSYWHYCYIVGNMD